MTDTENAYGPLRVNEYGRLYFGRLDSGADPQKTAEDLLKHYSQSIGATPDSIFGPSKYLSAEAIISDAKSGKIKWDIARQELERFYATQAAKAGKGK